MNAEDVVSSCSLHAMSAGSPAQKKEVKENKDVTQKNEVSRDTLMNITCGVALLGMKTTRKQRHSRVNYTPTMLCDHDVTWS